jgi:uncharacterized circularly permuted ATP-grasp superfamily protein
VEVTTIPYLPSTSYDELVGEGGEPRPLAAALWRRLGRLGLAGLAERQRAADDEVRSSGLTFRTAEDDVSADRPWPFDLVPRVLSADEWGVIESGLVQRLIALNRFIDDAYHAQDCVRAGVVPDSLVTRSPNFRPECVGVDVDGGVWAHICGSDLVRTDGDRFVLLEDNLRVPSGVSYLLENRLVSKRVFPELFRAYSVLPVDQYLGRLGALLASVAPVKDDPRIVVLTPGAYNSAYFEHAFLAQQLGVDLVEGGDLVVPDDDTVYMRTIDGLERVDVIYRRIDDLYLDPEVFRRDSVIGTPGLLRAWAAGNVAIVNAPGTGVADDKAVFPLVPAMIRFYLAQEPILPSVPTWRCAEDAVRRHVLANLDSLVVKPTNQSGGYGVVIGRAAGPDALTHVARRIEQHPAGWVAQPTLDLSTMPTLIDGALEPRHVDLRPFALLAPTWSYVTPGGLTRVAREADSLIVNSSQGGGSKDTWVVDRVLEVGADDPAPRAPRAADPPDAAPVISRVDGEMAQ